jgi:uncharacterized membrane protein
MDAEARRKRLTISGILFGLGLGGFFDGIVLHQILQWHHMVSHVDDYPMTTVAGLEANTLGDGLFHAATWLATVVGLFLLWGVTRQPNGAWSTRMFIGLLLMGWGLFNVVEGIVDHHLLQFHHVREESSNQLAWDLGFLAWGAAMVIGGWLLKRSGQEDMAEVERAATSRATAATTGARRPA